MEVMITCFLYSYSSISSGPTILLIYSRAVVYFAFSLLIIVLLLVGLLLKYKYTVVGFWHWIVCVRFKWHAKVIWLNPKCFMKFCLSLNWWSIQKKMMILMLNNQIGTMFNYRFPHLNPVVLIKWAKGSCFCYCYKHMMSEGCALANLIISS
jgi:hypothetical protein